MPFVVECFNLFRSLGEPSNCTYVKEGYARVGDSALLYEFRARNYIFENNLAAIAERCDWYNYVQNSNLNVYLI